MREKRNQEREKWRDGRLEEQSTVSGSEFRYQTLQFGRSIYHIILQNQISYINKY